MPQLPPPNQPASQTGSGFTNLSRYLNANTNNQLGNTVAGGIQQAGQAATGAVNKAGQQFQTQLGAEQQRLGAAGQEVKSVLGNIPGATAQNVQDFSNITSGQYKGPSGLNSVVGVDTDALKSQAASAENLGKATGSNAGRFGLLQQFVGRGNNTYGVGAQGLDNLLLGQQGQKQLQGARAATTGLGAQTQQTINTANAQGQQGQAQANQLAASTKAQLSGAITDYDKAMQQQLASQQLGVNNTINSLNSSNTNTPLNLDANTISQLNAASQGQLAAGTNLYNVDVSPYITANNLYANKQGAQSQSDFAKATMLGKLAGNSLNGQATSSTLQNYLSHPDMVGSYQANNPYNIDAGQLASALGNAKNAYDTQENSITGDLNSGQRDLGDYAHSITDALGKVDPNVDVSTQRAVAQNIFQDNNIAGIDLSPLQSISNYLPTDFIKNLQAKQAANDANIAARTANEQKFNILRKLQQA